MAPAVRLRSAVALQGGFPVLAGASIDVHPGEVVLLQGPNGAGKTSLLRTCAGLLAIASGRAIVLGCDLSQDRRAVRRRVGLMGHATALYDDLTVEDNVHFVVQAAKGDRAAVEPALARLGLDGRLRTVSVRRLSAGQRRRTALAGLVARRPELWLLDEPHAGLDAEYRDLLDDVIRQAAADGAAIVMASHERERATAIADRVLAMAGGLVLAPPVDPAERASAGRADAWSDGPGDVLPGGPDDVSPGGGRVEAVLPSGRAEAAAGGIFPNSELEAAHVA